MNINPQPLFFKKEIIEDFSRKIANKLKFHDHNDIFKLVSQIGGKIHIGYSNNEFEDNIMIVDKDANVSILISPFTSLKRDELIIAHELGHLFLHYPKIRSKLTDDVKFKTPKLIDLKNKEQKIAEMEANWFANAFLENK